MQWMSDAFRAALRKPMTVASRVDVVDPDDKVIASTAEGSSVRLPVAGGEVVVDRSQDWRSRLTLRLADGDGEFVPVSATDLLSIVSGNEIVPYRGLVLPGGSVEMKQLGVFGLARNSIADRSGGLAMSLTCHDRSREVDRNGFVSPYVVDAGSLGTAAIQTLVLDRRPGTKFRVVASTLTLPRLVYDEQARPWSDAVQKMASAIGYEAFFAWDGACVLQPIPDPSTAAVSYVYAEGQAALSGVEREMDNERAANYVVVLGENASNAAPVRGSAWDSDPRSPTYAGNPEATPPVPPGPYGLVVKTVVRPDVLTAAQAVAAAEGELRDVKGVPEVVSFDAAAVNPCHEGSDVVHIERERAGVFGEYVLERFNIPLTAADGVMRATTRERRVL